MLPRRADLGLAALALAAAGLSWCIARRSASQTERNEVGRRVDEIGRADSGEELRPPQGGALPETRTPPAQPAPVPTPEIVLVHGRVLRGSLSVEGYEVAFQRASTREEADWDLTDEDGRYAVRLEAASYLVSGEGEDDDCWSAEILVPHGRTDLELDLRVP